MENHRGDGILGKCQSQRWKLNAV